jgi:hypothetical protein
VPDLKAEWLSCSMGMTTLLTGDLAVCTAPESVNPPHKPQNELSDQPTPLRAPKGGLNRSVLGDITNKMAEHSVKKGHEEAIGILDSEVKGSCWCHDTCRGLIICHM